MPARATSPTVADLVARAASRIGSPDARFEAERLLCHVLDRGRAWLFAHARDTVAERDVARFDALIARRAAGEPVAYLTGTCGFWTLDLDVMPATLIPRADTERLVELALERIPVDAVCDVVDLGTGSGAIALAIANERPQARVVATDASDGALDVARRNAARHELGNVDFRRGDWWQAVGDRRFDVAVSNPPYIAQGDAHLAAGDLRFEPRSALASGPDGLDAIRAIVRGAPAHLEPRGWLLFEHGHRQGEAARALLREAGFMDVATAQDIEQRDRVSFGRIG